MSNEFELARRDHADEPIEFTAAGLQFQAKPRLTSRSLEAIAGAADDPASLFTFLREQLGRDGLDRVHDELDLGDEDLFRFVQFVLGLYGDPGKSSGSPTSPGGAGAS